MSIATARESNLRTVVKRAAEVLAKFINLPAILSYQCHRRMVGPERAFPGWSQWFSLLPGISGVFLRRAFYRQVVDRCGPDAHIAFGTVFSHPTVQIGNGVYIGLFCVIGDVDIADHVLISSHVSIINGGRQHPVEVGNVPRRDQLGNYSRISIGRDAWIGERSVVMADVGAHAVVGAGAVVTKPVPEYAVVVGSPARIIRYCNRTETNPDSPVDGSPRTEVLTPCAE
jgi:virginiamycin A acetyltransferase